MSEHKFEWYVLASIIILAVGLRLFFAFSYHEVWWDSGVYIGMGKYLFSHGQSGLWEHIRPPLLPIVLGFVWWIGEDPLFIGLLLEIVLMAGVVVLTYFVGRDWFGAKAALLASLMVALSPIFFVLSFHQYTEIPAVFLVLLALLLFQRERLFSAGVVVGLAFLAKFPAGMFLVVLGLFLVAERRERELLPFLGGFAVATVPYFAASAFIYGSPFATLRAGQVAAVSALGCNVLRYHPWWYYGYWLIFSESLLYVFALPALFFLTRGWSRKRILWAFSLVIPLVYFMQLHCRDYRYLTLFLPFVAMLAAFGVVQLLELKTKKRSSFVVLLLIFGVVLGHAALLFYGANEVQAPDAVLERYVQSADKLNVSGELWSSNPVMAAFTDRRLEKVYYPVYNGSLAVDFKRYLEANVSRVGAVFLDNCGGGIICPPDELPCEDRTESLVRELDRDFVRIQEEESGRCWYRVWAKGNVTS